MKRLTILLLLLTTFAYTVEPVFAQQNRRSVWYLQGRPGVEDADCDLVRWPDVYIVGYNAGDTFLGNVMICNPSDLKWDELAPVSASNRTLVSAEDFDTISELSAILTDADLVPQLSATAKGNWEWEDAAGDTTIGLTSDATEARFVMDSGGTNGEALFFKNIGGPISFQGCGAAGGRGPSPLCAMSDEYINMITPRMNLGHAADEDIRLSFDRASTDPWIDWDESEGLFGFSDGLFLSQNDIKSNAGSTVAAFEFNAGVARTTGDIAEWLDNGTWKMRLNSAGNLQMHQYARMFFTYGSDESVYNNTWGQVAIRDLKTGDGTGFVGAVNLRTNLQLKTSTGGGTFRSLQVISEADFSGTTVSGAVLTGAFYEVNEQESTNNGNSLDMYGQQNRIQMIGDSTTTVTRAVGTDIYMSFLGDNTTVTDASFVRIWGNSSKGTGTTVVDHYGLEIDDLYNHGTNNAVIHVDAQSNGDGGDGNIEMTGNNYNEGHFQTGSYHIFDSGDGLLVEDGDPTSDTDGERIDCPHNDAVGKVFWGDKADTAFDTGTEVCDQFNLTCKDTYDFGGATGGGCGANFHTNEFMVLCY